MRQVTRALRLGEFPSRKTFISSHADSRRCVSRYIEIASRCSRASSRDIIVAGKSRKLGWTRCDHRRKFSRYRIKDPGWFRSPRDSVRTHVHAYDNKAIISLGKRDRKITRYRTLLYGRTAFTCSVRAFIRRPRLGTFRGADFQIDEETRDGRRERLGTRWADEGGVTQSLGSNMQIGRDTSDNLCNIYAYLRTNEELVGKSCLRDSSSSERSAPFNSRRNIATLG